MGSVFQNKNENEGCIAWIIGAVLLFIGAAYLAMFFGLINDIF